MWKVCKFEQRENGIAILTLNRPEQLNSLNIDMCEDIINVANKVKQDEKIKVLVITGAGRGFSTGGDIEMLQKMDGMADAKYTFDLATRVVQSIYELDKPVIAAVNGPVAGASVALMLACDLVVASDKAIVGFSFLNVALCPDSGCSYFLTRKVGQQKAAEILFFGQILKANEALQLGLLNKVVSPDETMTEAINWAEKLAVGPSLTLQMNKKIIRQAYFNSFREQAELESLYQLRAFSSEDFKEGTRAFFEKRKAVFQGK